MYHLVVASSPVAGSAASGGRAVSDVQGLERTKSTKKPRAQSDEARAAQPESSVARPWSAPQTWRSPATSA